MTKIPPMLNQQNMKDLAKAIDWAVNNPPSDKIPPIFQNAMDESLDAHFESETFGSVKGG